MVKERREYDELALLQRRPFALKESELKLHRFSFQRPFLYHYLYHRNEIPAFV